MKLADSLPLIEKLPQCKSSQEVGAAFTDFVAPHGFMAAACGGKSDTDIRTILGISHATAHFHTERAKKKLAVKTRTQAAATVVALGYL
jgi:regulatory LuxR family protein